MVIEFNPQIACTYNCLKNYLLQFLTENGLYSAIFILASMYLQIRVSALLTPAYRYTSRLSPQVGHRDAA